MVVKGMILGEVSDIFKILEVPSNININLDEDSKIISNRKGMEYTLLQVWGTKIYT